MWQTAQYSVNRDLELELIFRTHHYQNLENELSTGSQDKVKQALWEMLFFMHPKAESEHSERWRGVTFIADKENSVHIKTFIWQEWKVARQLNDILIVFYSVV